MRARQVFMQSLVAHGVERIFGNPGTTESPLLDALADYPSIGYVMHLHEGVAVGAASYYARATGRAGVANLHVAPGLGNGIGMIYNALKACAPMVVTAGQQASGELQPDDPGGPGDEQAAGHAQPFSGRDLRCRPLAHRAPQVCRTRHRTARLCHPIPAS